MTAKGAKNNSISLGVIIDQHLQYLANISQMSYEPRNAIISAQSIKHLFSKDEKNVTARYASTLFKRLRAVAGIWTTKQ